MKTRLFCTVAVCLFTASPAFSAFTTGSSGLASPGDVITFGEVMGLTGGTLIDDQFEPFGLRFSQEPLAISPGSPSNLFISGSGAFAELQNFPSGVVVGGGIFTINLTAPQQSVALDLVVNGSDLVDLDVYSGSSLIGATQIAGTDINNLFTLIDTTGFTESNFDSIRFAVGPNGAAAIRTVQIATAVPEPGSLALLAITATGGVIARRRRNKKTATA